MEKLKLVEKEGKYYIVDEDDKVGFYGHGFKDKELCIKFLEWCDKYHEAEERVIEAEKELEEIDEEFIKIQAEIWSKVPKKKNK